MLIGYCASLRPTAARHSTCNVMRCSPPASNRGTSTRTKRPASAIIGRVWTDGVVGARRPALPNRDVRGVEIAREPRPIE